MVGTSGLLVDMAVLALLLNTTPLGAVLSRIVSIAIAMTNNWFWNRQFTFQRSETPQTWSQVGQEYLRFVAVNSTGALINYASYVYMVKSTLALSPYIALAIATFVSLAFNFLGSKFLAFRR
ncbi:GtrA family protein [Polycladidibacter hongkongensis]|uniref:GtrA family protein n=1 Tax=Polycladidibacter hongkongensis TaxID=1647556 RepID=UPI0008325710|nr:GtrA family protein [Pseudovibrio hongkongensis]